MEISVISYNSQYDGIMSINSELHVFDNFGTILIDCLPCYCTLANFAHKKRTNQTN